MNDLVLLCYDEQRSNYMVLTSEDTKYFLHPDSKSALKLNTGMLEPVHMEARQPPYPAGRLEKFPPSCRDRNWTRVKNETRAHCLDK